MSPPIGQHSTMCGSLPRRSHAASSGLRLGLLGLRSVGVGFACGLDWVWLGLAQDVDIEIPQQCNTTLVLRRCRVSDSPGLNAVL